MNTSTLTCIGFIQSLSKNFTDAVTTFHKALGQKREDTISSTMLTCVLEMCVEDQPVFNDYLDDEGHIIREDNKKPMKPGGEFKINDDDDPIQIFRNPKFRLWNRRLKKENDDSLEEDGNSMVLDSVSTAENNSSYSMDMSTNMSDN